jgi:hypothetical protein
METWTPEDIWEAEAQQQAAVEAEREAAGMPAQAVAEEECGFFCEFKKYGTGAIIGAVAAGGALLLLMLKK